MDLSPQERQTLAILVAYICKEHYYTDWSFAWCKDVFNKELLRSLDDFREKGNSMAYTLPVRVSEEDLDMSRIEVNHLTKSLFKTILLVASGKSSQT